MPEPSTNLATREETDGALLIGEAERRMPGFANSVVDTIDSVRPHLNQVSRDQQEHPLSVKTRDGLLQATADLLREGFPPGRQ